MPASHHLVKLSLVYEIIHTVATRNLMTNSRMGIIPLKAAHNISMSSASRLQPQIKPILGFL